KLPIYLGEYARRYKDRNQNFKEQENRLFMLLNQHRYKTNWSNFQILP
ncbi:MAG: hypothetical protein US36_C0006G0001, partial [Candidatus Wolfebacteria bacterium GW2011_GWC1_37_10]